MFAASRLLPVAVALLIALMGAPASAQGECGTADTLMYPVDTSVYRLAQDFGAPSPRHQGRYHTGEDWVPPRSDTYGVGEPVYAAAAGRVTYSSPIGWGRDGGVVIIEHTFSDGSVAYTQYGHMIETGDIRFPTAYTCVRQGDIIGAVGDVRPAPHLHFEVRVSGPDTPGPGYTWDDPTTLGFRHPARFIQNWQTWSQSYTRWRVDLPDGLSLPPAELDDYSLIYASRGRVVRLTPDGRVLWRLNVERPLAALLNHDGLPLLVYSDGAMQRINLDGTLNDRWDTGLPLAGPPLDAGDLRLFPLAGGGLAAFGPDLRAPLWLAPAWGADTLAAALAGPQTIGLVGANGVFVALSYSGAVLDRAQLREPGSLAATPEGALLAYTRGGLWTVDAVGQWALRLETVPPGGARSAVTLAPDGRLFLFDGAALRAYDRGGALLWETGLPGLSGAASLVRHGGLLLLTTATGDIVAVQDGGGALCGQARIYSDAPLWRSLGSDGLLRLAASDHLLALDWRRFIGVCAQSAPL